LCRTLHQLPDPPGEKKKKNVSFFGIGFPTKKKTEKERMYICHHSRKEEKQQHKTMGGKKWPVTVSVVFSGGAFHSAPTIGCFLRWDPQVSFATWFDHQRSIK